MKVVYLAAPYTKNPEVFTKHVIRAIADVLEKETEERPAIIAPTITGHQIAKENRVLASGSFHQYWYESGLELLRRCDELWVVVIPNTYSEGVELEIREALQRNMPVRYIPAYENEEVE